MSCLYYHHRELYIEDVKLHDIADQFGTPCYIYSRAAIEENWHAFHSAFNAVPHRIGYAVKANANIAILNLLAKLGSGFDIVSVGELERVIMAGGDPKKIIFSGVGKQQNEIERAIELGIFCFNVESEAELHRLHTLAEKSNKTIHIALRINPNIDPGTHDYIATGLKENKFGIELTEIIPLCQQLKNLPALKLIGIACHIGSQITELNPFLLAIEHLLEIYQQLQATDIVIQHINIGGGLGIRYHDEHPPSIEAYAKAVQGKVTNHPIEIILEPGRAIVGDAGILLMRIEYLKYRQQKNFAIVDAGMNDFLRHALYNAWQDITPVRIRDEEKKFYDIAGPLCESADFLGKNRQLAIHAGDLLAVDSAGAYGFCMSSNYNSRCRPAEILVDQDKTCLIRRRETIQELLALERVI